MEKMDFNRQCGKESEPSCVFGWTETQTNETDTC